MPNRRSWQRANSSNASTAPRSSTPPLLKEPPCPLCKEISRWDSNLYIYRYIYICIYIYIYIRTHRPPLAHRPLLYGGRHPSDRPGRDLGTPLESLSIYIYIYIHIYVCVCVCVCIAHRPFFHGGRQAAYRSGRYRGAFYIYINIYIHVHICVYMYVCMYRWSTPLRPRAPPCLLFREKSR